MIFFNESTAPCGLRLVTAPVSILPSTAAGPSNTRLLIWRNSSGSSPPTTVKPKPRWLFFSFVLMKVPLSSAGFLVKKGFPPAQQRRICLKQLFFKWLSSSSKFLNLLVQSAPNSTNRTNTVKERCLRLAPVGMGGRVGGTWGSL